MAQPKAVHLPITLDDKYALEQGRIYLTGTQALVRLALMQSWLDRSDGLNTEGFVTGYRGSPVGGVDFAFTAARKFAEENGIQFQQGVNEDLAATAIWGTQQVNLMKDARVDGVFSMWYGKGPGVDRTGDVFRHANFAGTSKHGGVLVLTGDDHTCKSSTTSHQSEYALMDAMIPVLNPSGVQDILDLGLYGWALSRFSGCWVGMKLIAETMDSSATVNVGPDRTPIVIPSDHEMPPGGVNIRWPNTPQEMERRLHTHKIPAALAFARANRLDKTMLSSAKRRIGIVTAGKSYLDVRSALSLLEISDEQAADLGLEIYKVAMTWPLEPEGLKTFASGLTDIVVVEEKRPLLETQIKDILYHLPADGRPRVTGKNNADNQISLPAHDDLGPTMIARAIGGILLPYLEDGPLLKRIAILGDVDHGRIAKLSPVARIPYFCSGCPHNTSTRVPEGSRAMAGIGCSYMVLWMDRDTDFFTHMGGEGANWIGQAPFVESDHVFQNIGDGTYFHSGAMAIRAAVAAGVNMTYKVLFNDAVAMTGGQPLDGHLTPQIIAAQVRAEGVERIAVVTDDPGKYGVADFVVNTTIHHRDDLDAVQKELRDVSGISVLIYDQTCAAEKRRRRKRGSMPDPDRRIFINELVCEGCGDCSTKSNCLSVVPRQTEFGTKRRIDQSSCNKDFSCVNGFCPSFVSVEGAKLKKAKTSSAEAIDAVEVGDPDPGSVSLERPFNILVTGVGGTGVVTISALIAMAAHIEGRGASTLDMAGLAQKGGQVTSHIRLAKHPEELAAVRISDEQADLVLGCDLVVAGGREALSVMKSGATSVVLNAEEIVTSDFITDRTFSLPGDEIAELVRRRVGQGKVSLVDATKVAVSILGDSIGANLFMVGYAFQKGLIPLKAGSLVEAARLNGVSVAMNLRAFHLGRIAADNPETLNKLLPSSDRSRLEHREISQDLSSQISRRKAFLSEYQNAAYADQYATKVNQVVAAETALLGTPGDMSKAVAENLFKLMAYKDEYEIARLYSASSFKAQLEDAFEGWTSLRFYLAPPLWPSRSENGEPKKTSFGPWMLSMFSLLARFKGLRGTRFDPFGYTDERRAERDLISRYIELLDIVLGSVSAKNLGFAVELLRLPDKIRGFGHVKKTSIAEVEEEQTSLLAAFQAPGLREAAE